jgi:hypothetical protein
LNINFEEEPQPLTKIAYTVMLLAQVLMYNKNRKVSDDFAFLVKDDDPRIELRAYAGIDMENFSFSVAYSLGLEPDGKDEIRGFGTGKEGFEKAIAALESLEDGYFIHATYDDGNEITELTISPKDVYNV